jgi:benzodiazapine receptor
MNKFTKIAIMVATCLAIGFLSGQATQAGVDNWFPLIKKPSFNPPAWLFAPVWTMLYIMMGVAAGMVWDHIDRQRDEVRKALIFFAIQLALNALWSVLFFGLRNPLLAFIEIIILWLMIFETYTQFRRIDTFASWLMLPYLAWVSFATVLNGTIWWMNR